jgi:hypothetical protein
MRLHSQRGDSLVGNEAQSTPEVVSLKMSARQSTHSIQAQTTHATQHTCRFSSIVRRAGNLHSDELLDARHLWRNGPKQAIVLHVTAEINAAADQFSRMV